MSGGRDWMEGVPCRVGNETTNIVVIPVHSRRRVWATCRKAVEIPWRYLMIRVKRQVKMLYFEGANPSSCL